MHRLAHEFKGTRARALPWRQAWKPVEPAPPRVLCTDDHRKNESRSTSYTRLHYPMRPQNWWGRCHGAAVLQAAPCYLPASLAPHTVALRTPLPLRSLSRARAAQRHFSATAPAARSARVSEHVRAQKGLRPRRGRCHLGKAQGWSDAGSGEGRFLVRLGIGLEWARAGVGPGLGLGLGLGYQG